ncbi:MAG TPA: cytidylate kinase family protein [Candidatus Nanoarchaeia archaeon]|nr:cytidylate kinase family protein [Candidatus Nanoarchaeia archaeon]
MIITISGTPGSGKSTVGSLLSKKLKCGYYDIGKIRRAIAKKREMTLEEYNRFGESDESTDKEVDDYQRELGKSKDNIVLVSRLGYHFVPNSFKVFLKVNLEEAAKRIMKDPTRSKEEKPKTLKDALRMIEARNASDKKRYKKYYGINPYENKHYDLIIDTYGKSPAEIVDEILKATKNF